MSRQNAREMSSRSARVRARRERRRAAGGIPPRGNNKQRMEVCGLPKARPISCNDCPDFQRLQISDLSVRESLDRFPSLISTYRIHRANRTSRAFAQFWPASGLTLREDAYMIEHPWRAADFLLQLVLCSVSGASWPNATTRQGQRSKEAPDPRRPTYYCRGFPPIRCNP
jgi:hypothetical protein